MIEIIKKANVLPNSLLKQKLYAAEKLSGKYSVHMICDALDIARGTITIIFSAIKGITLGTQNEEKISASKFKRFLMKTVKFSVPER